LYTSLLSIYLPFTAELLVKMPMVEALMTTFAVE